jgi:hypothetical protein
MFELSAPYIQLTKRKPAGTVLRTTSAFGPPPEKKAQSSPSTVESGRYGFTKFFIGIQEQSP